MATRESLAFVYGGYGEGVRGDISVLDIETDIWSKFSDGPKLWRHSLSAISSTRLLVIGGDPTSSNGGISDKTWIFDRKDSS